MIDIKYYNTLKKVAKFKNDNCNYNEHKGMEDIIELHENFMNECKIDWNMLNQYILTIQRSYLYFKDDKYYGKKCQKINKLNNTNSINNPHNKMKDKEELDEEKEKIIKDKLKTNPAFRKKLDALLDVWADK
tara:strand:- start:155 stop:550 length:396 start_codon:yes stop_codon:yes gene_type:complete